MVQARRRFDSGPLEAEFMKFRRLGILPAPTISGLASVSSDYKAAGGLGLGPCGSSNARAINSMLQEYNERKQEEMIERMLMDEALAFWNPLDPATIRSRDATS